MNFLVSIALSIFMAASATPTNPVIINFIEEGAVEAQKAGMDNPISYEETFLGPAVVITQEVPAPSAQIREIPANMVKPDLIKEMKGDSESRQLIEALKETKTLFIIRMMGNDGQSVDFIISPNEW